MKKLLLSLLFIPLLGQAQTIGVEDFATGFTGITDITHAGDDRLFVTQQNGQIRIVNSTGQINTTPFLNISNLITASGEAGLLGLAFHPNYQENGYFYLNYSQQGTYATRIARYQVNPNNPDLALSDSGVILLTISQPYSNHNGGCLRFGPDGYLYIGMGDGGSGGDPGNRAQNNNELLGKMLRIDVDNGELYAIPADNPFASNGQGAPEIFATGMRNPWKFSFDRETGDLWIADVGQNEIEEINKMTQPLTPGLNYGWRCYEGNIPYNTNGCQSAASYTMPFTQYSQQSGLCSITGGYVHRNDLYPGLNGKYILGDYCSNRLATVDEQGNLTWHIIAGFNGNVRSFGEDQNGQLYVNSGNAIMKIVDLAQNDLTNYHQAPFAIAPNPAREMIQIRSLGNDQLAQVVCFSLEGKQLELRPIDQQTYSTAHLQAGVYFLQLQTEQAKSYTYRLVIE